MGNKDACREVTVQISFTAPEFLVTSMTFVNSVQRRTPLEVNCQQSIFLTAYILLKFIDLINNQLNSIEIVFAYLIKLAMLII